MPGFHHRLLWWHLVSAQLDQTEHVNLSIEVASVFFFFFFLTKVSMILNFWFDTLIYVGLFLCFGDQDWKVDSGG